MTGQIAFEAMNAIGDELIEEAVQKLGFSDEARSAIAPARRGPRHVRGENRFARFMGSGWGAAVICGVVALGVLTAIVWAGRQPIVKPPIGTNPPSSESQTQTAITEAQAIEIASSYWGIRTGDVDPDTGFTFRIESMGQTQTSDGTAVYQIALRWLVSLTENSHYSTLETVWVDMLTGEIIIPYEDTATETEAHVHIFSEWQILTEPTCSAKGERSRSCPCGEIETEAIPTLPHTEVIDPAVPPTITETGLKEGKHCEVCGKVLVKQTVIPATGHTDLAYEIHEDGRTCTITGMGTCTATEIYIPSAIDGYKVTRIGEIAFIGKPITAVRFPSSVTEIYDGAFHGCTELTEITLPSSITYLGSQVFQACTGLTTATLQCRITELPHMIFEGCTSLTSVTLPNTLTLIRIGAFSNCTALREITFPASLGIIGPGVFQGCTALTNVILPAKLGILDDMAFEGCISLTEMVLPDTLNRIGANAFSGCSGITAMTVPTGVAQAEPSAFERMEGLTDIYFRGTEAEWNAIGYIVGENVQIHFGA
ncbi:MAG: leucine-rich repeat domain-containing protein [Clostridia bacterium]|nr:leucine-rich repeat domain-containing protein [Clostridia bacterium]